MALALALDLALGEPPAAVHPVVWFGRAVTALDRFAPIGRVAGFAYGAATTAILVAGAAAAGVG